MRKMIFGGALVVGLLVAGNVFAGSDDLEFGLFTGAEEQGQIYLVKEESGDVMNVDVMVKGVELPLLGAAFHLKYDDRVEYLSFSEGEVLEKGGDQPIYLVKNVEDDREVVVGVSLKRGDVLVKGLGRLLRLSFRRVEDGELNFVFDDQVVSTLENGKRVDLVDVQWVSAGLIEDASEVSEEKNSDSNYVVLGLLSAGLLILVIHFVKLLRE